MLKNLRLVAVAAATLAVGALTASAARAQILNSERIEQTFGSYGVEVIYADERIRLSDLYSLHDRRPVTRTFALVRYPDEVDPAFAPVHAAIVAGGSIGTTFEAAGWTVVKDYHQYFRIRVSPRLAATMGVASEMPLAAHAYRLEVARDDRQLEYALIVEIHHPDYLREEDLVRIYGPEVVIGMPDEIRELLESGLVLLERNLPLSQ
ncbi:MAG TPA: hypothetical protein VMR74_00070 [Gammaproteobacteria bacterium]|nr:hypothetical protein [Gammaproteobacteria bacterium]